MLRSKISSLSGPPGLVLGTQAKEVVASTDAIEAENTRPSIVTAPKMPAIRRFSIERIPLTVEEIEIVDPHTAGFPSDFRLDLSAYKQLKRLEISDNEGHMSFVITGLPESLEVLSLHGVSYSAKLDLDNLPPKLRELSLSAPFHCKLRLNSKPLPVTLEKLQIGNMEFDRKPDFGLFGENLKDLVIWGANFKKNQKVTIDLATVPPSLERIELIHNGFCGFENEDQLPATVKKKTIQESDR